MGQDFDKLKNAMKKNRMKTYAVRGLMELNLRLPTGSRIKPFIEVHFERGQITGYGVTPARYSTADPFVQRLIECNRLFLNGRIYIQH